MSLKSLTMRSELLTLSGISALQERPSFIVQSTPDEPNYWMGNQIILQSSNVDYPQAIVWFEQSFPDARHRSFVWDIPSMSKEAIPGDFAENGFSHDDVDALVLTKPLREVQIPTGIVIRPLVSQQDWFAALELQNEVGIEEGYTQPTHRAYLEQRNANRRVQISKGLGQWFGAFDGDILVSQLGIFHDYEVARYQSVETRHTHRRRGICSAMLRHAALWALDRAPRADVVIVAQMGGDAGRLYRSMGFTHEETIHGVIRSGV